MSWYTTYRSAMLVATCNRLFQTGCETRTIEIDDSIVRRYASDTERDRESYTEVCDVCFSRPIISDVQARPILTSAHLDRGMYGRPLGMNLRPLSATALLTLTASAESGCGCQQVLDYGPLSLEE